MTSEGAVTGKDPSNRFEGEPLGSDHPIAGHNQPPESAWRGVHWLTPLIDVGRVVAGLVLMGLVISLQLYGGVEMFEGDWVESPPILFLGVAGVVVLVSSVFAFFAWRARAYALTDQAVWSRSGIFFKEVKNLPLERIQTVDVVQPLLGRVFGLGRIFVDAAGGEESVIKIGFIPRSEIDRLRADILARAAGIHAETQAAHSEEIAEQSGLPEAQEHRGVVGWPTPKAVEPYEERGPKPIPEAPERILYTVPVGRLVAAGLSNWMFMGLVLFSVAAVTVSSIVAMRVGLSPYVLVLPSLLPAIMIGPLFVWISFAPNYGFTAATSPDGIRIRRGFLAKKEETIPPERVHAVSISQPPMWRLFGWYEVRISRAISRGEDEDVPTDTLLPAGSKEEAMLATWLVLPDLGVRDPERFFNQALSGTPRGKPFVHIPRRAVILDPFVYSRRSMALTETCVVSRDGFPTAKATFVPYRRVQSMAVGGGPILRALRLANVTTCTVGLLTQKTLHLDWEDAAHVMEEVRVRSQKGRAAEPPSRWLSRVLQAVPPPDAGVDALGRPQQPSAIEMLQETRGPVDFRPPRKG